MIDLKIIFQDQCILLVEVVVIIGFGGQQVLDYQEVQPILE
jgi:hypothetical protein